MKWRLDIAAINATACGEDGVTELRGERRVGGGASGGRGGDGVEAGRRGAVGCKGARWWGGGSGGGGVGGKHVEAGGKAGCHVELMHIRVVEDDVLTNFRLQTLHEALVLLGGEEVGDGRASQIKTQEVVLHGADLPARRELGTCD